MNKIVVIAGPTAVGKTEYAIKAAQAFNGEIVSCDSMQLYKYMDIGSAKPTIEEQKAAPHHLVDIIDPRDDFSVAEYQNLAKDKILTLLKENKLPVIAGGTGLYLNSILYDMDFGGGGADNEIRKKYEKIAKELGNEELYKMLQQADPDAAKRLHPNNTKRVIRALESIETGHEGIKSFNEVSVKTSEYEAILIGLTRDRAELYDRINRRVDIMMDLGLVDEVRKLMSMGLDADSISMKGIGYKEIIRYLNGEYDIDEAVRLIKRDSRRYAKRQLTWFKRYDDMKWFNLSYEGVGDMLSWLKKRI